MDQSPPQPKILDVAHLPFLAGCFFGYSHYIVASVLDSHPTGMFTKNILQTCLLSENDILFVLKDLYTVKIVLKSKDNIFNSHWKLNPAFDISHLSEPSHNTSVCHFNQLLRKRMKTTCRRKRHRIKTGFKKIRYRRNRTL